MNDNVLSTQGDAMFRCVRLPLIYVDLSRTDYASRSIDIWAELTICVFGLFFVWFTAKLTQDCIETNAWGLRFDPIVRFLPEIGISRPEGRRSPCLTSFWLNNIKKFQFGVNKRSFLSQIKTKFLIFSSDFFKTMRIKVTTEALPSFEFISFYTIKTVSCSE